MALSIGVNGLLKGHAMNQRKFAQLDKVLCTWFMEIDSKEKTLTGPTVMFQRKNP
jgi:hypothetical protein